ncbi:MAG: ABC transporter ATP-binding protein [Candidatus Natronoplasma sp.]
MLKDINLDIRLGEIMGLLGPSGSGKSTLLRCLNRIIEPDSGDISYKGKDLKDYPPIELRKEIVLVPQESVMFSGTVFDNVAYGPSIQGEVDREHILNCIRDAGLSADFEDRKAEKLSGGEKRRVALARALAMKPDILLLDEPTSGVDPKKKEEVEKSILNFSKKRDLTVLWVTHDVEQAKRVSTRIANLRDGRIFGIYDSEDFDGGEAF